MVYSEPPFGGPEHVLKYLARYTHRVAISNGRLLSLDDSQVSFRWRDSRHNNRSSIMTLDAVEFIRRFLLHVLPPGFVKIRPLRTARQPQPTSGAGPLEASSPAPRLQISARCYPNSRSLHSTAHARSANTEPCTSSHVIRLANRSARAQRFTALPSILLEETMRLYIPIRSLAPTVSRTACATLRLESAPHTPTQPSSLPTWFATTSRTRTDTPQSDCPRVRSTVSAPRRRYSIPIHPPR